MTEPADPTGTTVTRIDQDPPLRVPPFVCVVPCTKPAISYGDRLDGCANGMHATLEDTKDLQVHLYPRMADVILAKNAPLEEDSEDPCAVCMSPIVPSSSSPVMYLERCVHYFHYYCVEEWRSLIRGNASDWVSCPKCRTESNRTLFWPQLFPTTAAKNQMFQLQMRGFGIDVAPETVLYVLGSSTYDEFPNLLLELNGKYFSLRQRKPPLPQEQVAPPVNAPGPQPAPPEQVAAPVVTRPPYIRADHGYVESTVVQAIQELHLADQPRRFFLGDILPIRENPEYQALYGPRLALDEHSRRESILLQFWCPFDRVNVRPGEQCSLGQYCEFFHGWPQDTPMFIRERVMVRHFPNFFCLDNARFYVDCVCIERIQVHSQDLARCSASFHPTSQDLKDIDEFASKMASQITSPVVVPEPSQHLVCFFCRKSSEPNSVWIHMKNCDHCMHVGCLPLVRHNYRHLNRKLDVHCAACQVPSVRTIAWPGPFRSDMVKQEIFKRQLYEFKNLVLSDIQVAVVQVGQTNIFTVDYGGPRVVTIDWASAPHHTTMWFD